MTYSQYGQVQSTDYNGFVSTGTPNFNAIWSTLYGQTALSTVTAYSSVASNPWDNLVNGIANAAAHQGTTIASVTPPPSGSIVAYISAMSTNLSDIYANRYNLASTGTDITNTGTRTDPWGVDQSIPAVSSTITVTFGSAQEAQYFFNLGGTVLLNCSHSGGSTPDDTIWTDLCAAIGTIGLPGFTAVTQTIAGATYYGLTNFGGSGSPDIYIRDGFDTLPGTPTTLFRQYNVAGASAYTSDGIAIQYSATATVITITVTFTDGTTAPSGGTVSGTLSVTGIARPPSTTGGITPNWGTPVVAVSAPA